MSLPDYLIYRKKSKYSEIEVRKLRGDKEVGINVTRELSDMPGSIHAETFLTRKDAIELIEALREYFNIKE
jgi:hypothetical protein